MASSKLGVYQLFDYLTRGYLSVLCIFSLKYNIDFSVELIIFANVCAKYNRLIDPQYMPSCLARRGHIKEIFNFFFRVERFLSSFGRFPVV